MDELFQNFDDGKAERPCFAYALDEYAALEMIQLEGRSWRDSCRLRDSILKKHRRQLDPYTHANAKSSNQLIVNYLLQGLRHQETAHRFVMERITTISYTSNPFVLASSQPSSPRPYSLSHSLSLVLLTTMKQLSNPLHPMSARQAINSTKRNHKRYHI